MTGASGFVGGFVVEKFFALGWSVIVTEREQSNFDNLGENRSKIDFIAVENLHSRMLDLQIEVVIHCAANYGRNGESKNQLFTDNVYWPAYLHGAAAAAKCSLFINLGTALDPSVSLYAQTKACFSDFLSKCESTVKIVDLRADQIYGPGDHGQKLVPWLLEQFDSGSKEVELTSGRALRNFIYISDLMEIFVRLVESQNILERYQAINITSEEKISVFDFIQALRSAYIDVKSECVTDLLFGSLPDRPTELASDFTESPELKTIGYKQQISIETGMRKIMEGLV